jgi:hypothetical protein
LRHWAKLRQLPVHPLQEADLEANQVSVDADPVPGVFPMRRPEVLALQASGLLWIQPNHPTKSYLWLTSSPIESVDASLRPKGWLPPLLLVLDLVARRAISELLDDNGESSSNLQRFAVVKFG